MTESGVRGVLGDDPREPPDESSPRRLSARSLVLVISGMSSLILATVIALLPVPYVIFSPGPVRDTLGETPDGEALITVDGTPTFPTSGELDLTTISVSGGPLGDLSIADIVLAWINPAQSVRPVESVYPSQETRQEAEEAGAAEMASAQQAAAVAALQGAGIEVPVRDLLVVDVDPAVPAAGALEAGDAIRSFDGRPITGTGALVELVRARDPGDVVPAVVERDGEQVDVDIELSSDDAGMTLIGVLLEAQYELPFDVAYDVSGIGGPSAGMMFALGIYDKITEGELTGGNVIAGTGTITEDGVVGPIDGIQQKMVAARRHGAAWFLAPADNCGDVVGAVPDGLRVVRVAEFDEAVSSVEAIAAGDTADLATCT